MDRGRQSPPTGDPPQGGPAGAVVGAWRQAWPVVRVVVGFGLAAVAIWVLYGRGGELQDVLFDQLRWWWLVPAGVVEALSLVAFAVMQYRLLAAGGVRAPPVVLVGTTFASQAISNSFPGGTALAAVYSFRWYRRFGADDAVAGWTLLGSFVGASLSLAVVAAIGVAMATEQGSSLGLVPVVVGMLAASVVMAVLFVHQDRLVALLRWCLARSRARTGHPGAATTVRVDRFAGRLAAVPLGGRGMLVVAGWGLASWLLDCSCFALSFVAVGAGVPWKALLLAYGAGQLAANLPITPGGLGVVEGSIEIALVYFGGARASTVAAVFVYRLISFWFELVVGWAAAGVLALGARRGRWAAAHPPEEAAPAPGPAPAGVPAPCAMVPPEVR